MFKRVLGYKTLWVVLVFAASWGFTLWSWRDHYRLPTAEDIIAHFLVIPTALCLGYWGVYLGVEWLKRRRQPGPAEYLADVEPMLAAEHVMPVQIQDWSLYLPLGDEPAGVIEALKARDRPALHPTLKDTNGFPRRIAWIDALSTEDFIESGQDDPLPIDVRRALLLASEVLEPLLMRHLERDSIDGSELRSPLPVHVLVPTRWSINTQTTARQWLVSAFTPFSEHGLECPVFIHGASDTRQVLNFIEQLRHTEGLDAKSHLQVVVAIVSFTQDDALLEALPEVSGEGACALLLACGLPATTGPVSAIVHPFRSEQRAQSADLPGKVRAATLQHLLEQYSMDLPLVSVVIADADQRTSRQTELLAALHTTLPELDPIDECLSLPVCCGEMGAVTTLASLALAASNSLETQQETLLVSVQDPFWRAVCRIQPSPPRAPKPLQDFA
ncbi:hypothetical protein [Pseudomonas weihenstephanensis]|uniref:hypothetical protein n=1 Tax=Pseudomonas weihenstephanensis TaxID=1608994 RepID=UPI00193C1F20|nr:hypothetical protein [Pseudomonas weihenstephanensis]MBM1189332.1 hypothetical protein [Pseudomonas weihenstephanensis]